jgi:nitronate monooxygenase
MRALYNLNSVWRMKRSMLKGFSTKDYWQAGKSVAGIERVESVGDIFRRFREKALQA